MPDAGKISSDITETVLVVEDDVLIRMTIAEYLRNCGFRVIEAVDGDEAVVVLEQSGLAVGVVFSIVEMAGPMDGFALKRWVRERYPELPVILAGTLARAIDAAADLCKSGPDLAKPYEPQLVLDRIRRLLAERARRMPKQSRTANLDSTIEPAPPAV
jgi:DNA-binding response OmpR family regulator